MKWPLARPAGVTIDVSLPRWPLRVAGILFGMGMLLLVVLAIPMAFLVNRTSGGGSSSATGLDVTSAAWTGDQLRVTAKISRSGDGDLGNNGWSVLLDDGNVVPGTVVEGPQQFWQGETSTVVGFALAADARPARLRFDPDGEFMFSQAFAAP